MSSSHRCRLPSYERGGSSVENGFNPDIFSTRRIVVGPLLSFLGFLLMAFAIVIPPDYLERKRKGKEKE